MILQTACDGDDSGSGGIPASDGGMPPPVTGSADGIDEPALAKCPSATTLIETTDWPSCLANRKIAGSEPFGNQPCELRIGPSSQFEYYRAGALSIAIPARATWKAPTGTYQNELSAGRRIFLASVAPDLPAVEGQSRVTNINLKFFTQTQADDLIEIAYLDAALARQTFTCKVDVK